MMKGAACCFCTLRCSLLGARALPQIAVALNGASVVLGRLQGNCAQQKATLTIGGSMPILFTLLQNGEPLLVAEGDIHHRAEGHLKSWSAVLFTDKSSIMMTRGYLTLRAPNGSEGQCIPRQHADGVLHLSGSGKPPAIGNP